MRARHQAKPQLTALRIVPAIEQHILASERAAAGRDHLADELNDIRRMTVMLPISIAAIILLLPCHQNTRACYSFIIDELGYYRNGHSTSYPLGPSANNSASLVVSHKLVSLSFFPWIDKRRTGKRDKASAAQGTSCR
jgi:hypothetical protein